MGEWLKPTDLKSVKAARSSGVRIPLPPPFNSYYSNISSINNLLKNTSRSAYVPSLRKKALKQGISKNNLKT